MSNNKSSNGRQMTLTQMTLALTNNIKSSQMGNNNNGNNKKKITPAIIKSNPPSTITNKKPQIHEIINLEQQYLTPNNQLTTLQGKNEQTFVGELAKKCGAFFNWINQVDETILGEQLWKNKMMQIVGERFPELNTQQQQKLIERDWKIMAPERKQKILKQMLKQIPYEQLHTQVNEKFQHQRNTIYLSYVPKQKPLTE